jgi:phosphoenolpyruvate carboxylase
MNTALPREEHAKERGEWRKIMDVLADGSRQRYLELTDKSPDFYDYFRLATPVDAIETMRLGMRPDTRAYEGNVDNLRAIPWDYAWTQSRHMLPGWFGFGTGLTAVIQQFGFETIKEMTESWYFFKALIYDVETVLARTDLNIATRYSALSGDLHDQFFPMMRTEFNLCVEQMLHLKDQQVLLEKQPSLRRSIRLRNPYVDPMSLLQVDLLHRWRNAGRKDDAIFAALVASINGIARGLQDSG